MTSMGRHPVAAMASAAELGRARPARPSTLARLVVRGSARGQCGGGALGRHAGPNGPPAAAIFVAADAEGAGGESGIDLVSWQAAFGQGVEGDAPEPAVAADLAGETRSRGEARRRRRRTSGREGRGEGKGDMVAVLHGGPPRFSNLRIGPSEGLFLLK